MARKFNIGLENGESVLTDGYFGTQLTNKDRIEINSHDRDILRGTASHYAPVLMVQGNICA